MYLIQQMLIKLHWMYLIQHMTHFTHALLNTFNNIYNKFDSNPDKQHTWLILLIILINPFSTIDYFTTTPSKSNTYDSFYYLYR